MKKPTLEEQLELRNKAKKELERLEEIDSDLANKYKEQYGICEIVYKVILNEHQRVKGKKTDYLKVQMTQVPYALKYAGYDFDKDFLDSLFGSNNKVGERSAKKLRDALTHSMNESAMQELRDREKELFKLMDDFFDKIRRFDVKE